VVEFRVEIQNTVADREPGGIGLRFLCTAKYADEIYAKTKAGHQSKDQHGRPKSAFGYWGRVFGDGFFRQEFGSRPVRNISRIRELAGGVYPVIRIMPNTPVSVGKGMILYCRNDLVDDETLADVLNDLRFAGILDPLEEKLIDAACAVSGCGPAFAYLFLEGLARGGVECGLSGEKALLYAAKMLEGAAKLAAQSDKTPADLRQAVCSPGGATIQGVYALERADFPDTVAQAVRAAYKRTLELK
jgi:hypothetical protein